MFHPRDTEKKVRLPWEHSPGKEEMWAGCCCLSIPTGPPLRRISMFQPQNSWWRRNFRKEQSRTAVTQTSVLGGWFLLGAAKAKVGLTLPGCFSQVSSPPEAMSWAPPLPRPQELLAHPTNALTLGDLCLSLHSAGTEVRWMAFNTWNGDTECSYRRPKAVGGTLCLLVPWILLSTSRSDQFGGLIWNVAFFPQLPTQQPYLSHFPVAWFWFL